MTTSSRRTGVDAPRLTGCVIVKDEATLLVGCLASLASFVDEIVVVDTGSSDSSPAVAEAFGASVVADDRPIGDLARNTYLEAATSDWIVTIDADERMTRTAGETVRRLIASCDDGVAGFALPRFDYAGNGRWYRNPATYRLYRNDPRIRYDDAPVHGTPGPALRQLGRIELAYAPIHHLDALLHGRAGQKRRLRSSQIRDELRRDPEDSRANCFLGLERLAVGDFSEAERLLERAFRLEPEEQVHALKFLAYLYVATDQLGRAEAVAGTRVAARHVVTFREQMAPVLAEIALRRGRCDEALAICTASLRREPMAPDMLLNVAALQRDREPRQALSLLERALRLNPLLVKPWIYVKGEQPNLYSRQLSLVSAAGDFFEEMARCHRALGDEVTATEWDDARAGILAAARADAMEARETPVLPPGHPMPPDAAPPLVLSEGVRA